MKTIIKTAVLSIFTGLLFIFDVPPELPLQVEMVPEAHAILGVRRRSMRRGVVIGSSMAASSAAAQSQPAAAPAAAPAPAPAPAPAADGGEPMPLGTVVPSLPGGCTTSPVGGVQYYHCGSNDFRAVFQGNSLVYITAKP